jgi:hypothetical protein
MPAKSFAKWRYTRLWALRRTTPKTIKGERGNVSERNPPMMINVINQSQEIKRACSVPGLDVGVLSSDICWLPSSRPKHPSSKLENSAKAVGNPYQLVTRDIRQREFIGRGILIEISMQKRGSEEWRACVQRHSVSILLSPHITLLKHAEKYFLETQHP